MGTSGTFEIVRTPASYIISQSGHGKTENGKHGFFLHFGQLLRCKIFQEVSRVCHGKPYVQSEILAMLAKIKVVKKMLRLQFCVSCSAIESASKPLYLGYADSIWKLETQNCSPNIFFNKTSPQVFFC